MGDPLPKLFILFDWLKNMASSGRGRFFLYPFKNLFVRETALLVVVAVYRVFSLDSAFLRSF